MPLSVTAENDEAREEFLRAYVTTYLSEEIRAEGLVRDLGAFSRFLEVASLAAVRTTNVSAIARDASVSRETARGYFEILVDTLLGDWLPAYRPRAKVKEVALPKFYWFDAGVLHAAAGGFDQLLARGLGRHAPGASAATRDAELHPLRRSQEVARLLGHSERQRGGLRVVAREPDGGDRSQIRAGTAASSRPESTR